MDTGSWRSSFREEGVPGKGPSAPALQPLDSLRRPRRQPSSPARELAAYQLYDLEADPGEQEDQASREPEATSRLAAILQHLHQASVEEGRNKRGE